MTAPIRHEVPEPEAGVLYHSRTKRMFLSWGPGTSAVILNRLASKWHLVRVSPDLHGPDFIVHVGRIPGALAEPLAEVHFPGIEIPDGTIAVTSRDPQALSQLWEDLMTILDPLRLPAPALEPSITHS